MNTMNNNLSTLKSLPDEILLEICKYLLCTDILLSFVGLNDRITQMITEYRHHVSLHKSSFAKSHKLFAHVFPQIGTHIRSITIDCCYSILQDDLFFKYFGNKMSKVFPELERISFVSYQYNQFMAILDNLCDLNHLVEIRLYSLFPVLASDEIKFTRSLMQANNHKLTTILIDNDSSCLKFDPADCYLNVTRLQLKLRSVNDLFIMFSTIPNIQYLDVTVDEYSSLSDHFSPSSTHPLRYLTDFQFRSTKHIWTLQELSAIFSWLPIVQHLSLCLLTSDQRLVESNAIIPEIPTSVQRFNYAIYFLHHMSLDQTQNLIDSWPLSRPVTCFYHDSLSFIHTLPCHLSRISFSTFISKIISNQTDRSAGYDDSVKEIELLLDQNFSLSKSIEILSQCQRVREITIYERNTDDTVKSMCTLKT